MGTIAGYRAIIEASYGFSRVLSGQVTAAGNTLPAKVFIIGSGVAGLSAISTAVSLGAIVRASDVRSEAKEQVNSLGAEFITINLEGKNLSSRDGYAKEMSVDLKKK